MKTQRWISPYHARSMGSAGYNRVHIGKPLTDKRIEQYRKLGRYSAEYREARRQAMKKKLLERQGGFVEVEPGRLVYSPL